MSLRNMLCLIAAVILLGATAGFSANAPELINYQGVLTSAGSPVTSPVDVTFRIYDAPSGGTEVWSQTQSISPDANGRFSTALGVNEQFFEGSERYLAIQVEGDEGIQRWQVGQIWPVDLRSLARGFFNADRDLLGP